MAFQKEVEKVGAAVESVTSRWKTWAIAVLFVVGVVAAVVAAVKFFL